MMQLGVCYYPEHWPESMWAEDAAQMKSIGLSIVRIGEFSWSRLEPKKGKYDFLWLDKVFKIFAEEGLQVILGTPSATPPRWVIDLFPNLLAWDKEGRPRKFGSRRHYCFSHVGYKKLAADMAKKLAQRYGEHPALYAWQTDNEYGCHDTTRSYSPNSKIAFQNWLSQKYKSISVLNKSWGNFFWSMEYSNFEQIDLPNLTVTEPNPSHKMDFYRFCSDQVIEWNRTQLDAIRAYSSKPIFHNYMGRITDFDHFKLGEEMEMATWDSYPLGFLEDRSDQSEAFKQVYQYSGDPDFQAFHHDLYKGVGKGRWGIMEQQPGPVNWAPYNPKPSHGMIRIWTLEAMAHGAEFVSYFRWRQLPFAQEQMHSALKRPDNRPTDLLKEIKLLKEELKTYGEIGKHNARVGLVFDYQSQWAWEVQPQGQNFDYFRLVYDFYCGLRRLGQDIDIIPPDENSLDKYSLIVVPGLFSLSKGFIKSLSHFKGEVLLGPRTHTKTSNFHINSDSIAELMEVPFKLDEVETLRPTEDRSVEGIGTFHSWLEHLKVNDKPIAPIYTKGNKCYLAGWPVKETLESILSTSLEKADLKASPQEKGVRQKNEYCIDYLNRRFHKKEQA